MHTEATLREEFTKRGFSDDVAIRRAIAVGLKAGTTAVFCSDTGLPLDEAVTLLSECKFMSSRDCNAYLRAGITDIRQIVELSNKLLTGAAAERYAQAGFGTFGELQAIADAKWTKTRFIVHPDVADRICACGFTSVQEILAALTAVQNTNGAKPGSWVDARKQAGELGEIGQRILKAHPVPSRTADVINRSKVLGGQLAALDDDTLKVVVTLIEQEEGWVEVNTAKRYIKMFS